MKIETFKINTLYRGIALEGNCRIIPYSTYSIIMEKPYKGLSKSAYFRNGFTMENIMGRINGNLDGSMNNIKIYYMITTIISGCGLNGNSTIRSCKH